MRVSNTRRLIQEYRKTRPLYNQFCHKLHNLLEDLLSKEAIPYHSLEGRTKSIESLAAKLQRGGRTPPESLKEVVDLCGLRIIVYYNDDVNRVCDMVSRELEVDSSRSIDKKTLLSPEQLGYLSVHNVVSLSGARAQSLEWSDFRNLKAEIQVRTILQHAWAQISHGLQYKRETDIPPQMRRKLLMLSGLLELADEEFSSLRQEQHALMKRIRSRIEELDLNIPVDIFSIREFIAASDTVKGLMRIVSDVGFKVVAKKPELARSLLVTACKMIGINDIGTLESQLVSLKPKASLFFSKFYSKHGRQGGRVAHWLTVAIIGVHARRFTEEEIESKFGWHPKYARDLLHAAQAFENTF